MGSYNSAASRSASPGKAESSVAEELEATGQQKDESNVTDDSELNQLRNQVSELQNQVSELQKTIENLEIQLTLGRKQKKELEQRLANIEQENHDYLHGEAMQTVVHKLQQAEEEVELLKQENAELHKELGNYQQPMLALPNLEEIRARTLNRLKVGRQSQAGKALDAFIKDLLKG